MMVTKKSSRGGGWEACVSWVERQDGGRPAAKVRAGLSNDKCSRSDGGKIHVGGKLIRGTGGKKNARSDRKVWEREMAKGLTGYRHKEK